MPDSLKILMVEDSDDDARLIIRELSKTGFSVTYERVDTPEAMIKALGQKDWNLILSDYVMPRFNGLAALEIYKTQNMDIPFLIISGKIGEEIAVEAMRLGAHDYLLKDNLKRLVPAVKRELHEASLRLKQKETDDALHNIEEQLASILDSLDIVVWSYDIKNKKLFHVSSGVKTFFGLSPEQLMENPKLYEKYVPKGDINAILKGINKLFEGTPDVHEFRVILPRKGLKWLEQHVIPIFENGELIRMNGVIIDISQRKQYEERIKDQAYYDPLTGLPNRLLLIDRVNMAILQAKRNQTTLAILFLDIDRFKIINDTLGHKVGDLILKEVGNRLKNGIREVDTVSRHGGDEFIILLPGMTIKGADEVANRLLSLISSPFYIDGYECFITGSIGISLFPENGDNMTTLIQSADLAMYRAKELGKNMVLFFSKELNEDYQKRSAIERELHWALERNQLMMYYQPQFDIRTLRLTGWEALIRWQHPHFGWIQPYEFIPIAEESGLIRSLGEWILKTSCMQNKIWQLEGYHPVPISVNLTAKQFELNNIVNTISSVLQETGLSPEFLELEITERMAMNIDYTISVLKKLKNIGVAISIDDFGTGYSSLNYLKQFPINTLKIDQSFVKDLGKDPDDESIVRTIISMAHFMKLKVIAEGVETKEQMEILKAFGCNEAQGYFLCKPMAVDECELFLKETTT
jgi:diguanylate cyclase (GGDEF)-like protein/PAS domain S-box-containing protein